MKHLGISSLAVLLLLAAGCAWLDRSETEDYVILQAALGDVQVVSTKGAPTTSLGNTFNVWAYVYPASGSIGTPNYTCGEVFTKQGATTTYESALIHGRIPTGYTVKYWALTPETVTALGGLSALPNATTSGVPSFSYTVPSSVASQTDLLVACTDWAGGSSTAPALAFQHVLSGVQFYATTSLPSCTVTRVELSEIHTKGTYTEGSSWSNLDTKSTLGIVKNVTFTNGTEKPVYVGDDTMMLIPGSLTSGSKLSVRYKVGDSAEKTAVADISAVTLPQGTLTKIILGISNDTITLTVVTAGQEIELKLDPSTIDIVWS
ncbi:MAG: fimbrillin family protein [Bacteroidales bacterium]|nr:fimbrillin family protein [Bacteroidales bacterium]